MTELSTNEVVGRFRTLTVWSKKGQRAPHKPLLCLLAISKLANGDARIMEFSAVEKSLTQLLESYGPPRKVAHPEYPFWCLQNEDGIWEVSGDKRIFLEPGQVPTRTALLRTHARGGFLPEVYEAFQKPEVRAQVVGNLLSAHFPKTSQEDLLEALRLSIGVKVVSGLRDPEFRDRVLSAYEYRCAICGFNVRVGPTVVALEAAHIKWHQAGGPDIQSNGLALCSLHHRLFDRGAFTLDNEHKLLVSERAYGNGGFEELLGRYHRKLIYQPIRTSYKPDAEFMEWHKKEVFFSPERE